MAPPIRTTKEAIKEIADAFPGTFRTFHIVHKLREKGLVGKGEDTSATAKANRWLKDEITAGRYEIAGKNGGMNIYARISPEYLQRKRDVAQTKSEALAVQGRFESAFTRVLGECEVRPRGVRGNLNCYGVVVDAEQMQKLTAILEALISNEARTLIKADKAEIHTGCGGEVRLQHEAWTCVKCGKIGVAIAETSIGEDAYPSDCGSCCGYGHFDEEGKPTMDKRCRKCLDCNGTGEHQP